jgi:hypothetical protein
MSKKSQRKQIDRLTGRTLSLAQRVVELQTEATVRAEMQQQAAATPAPAAPPPPPAPPVPPAPTHKQIHEELKRRSPYEAAQYLLNHAAAIVAGQ